MKRTILITLLLALGAAPCLSQTEELKEINLQHTQSVIREWNAGNAVAFLYNPYSTSYFCLESSSTPTTVLAAEVPRNARIYDFKILNDTLYFCGTFTYNNGNEYGIVGFFDIDDLFNHDGNHAFHSLKSFQITFSAPYYMSLLHSLKLVQNPSNASIPASWNLHDLRYNPQTHHVSLLQDMDYPVSTSTVSVIGEYNLLSAPSVTTTNLSQINGTRFFSIDSYRNFGVRAIGTDPTHSSRFFKKAIGRHICNDMSVRNYLNNSQNVSMRLVLSNEVWCSPDIDPRHYTPTVRKMPAVIDCVR